MKRFFLIWLGLLATNAFATVYTNVATGSWTNTATWSGGAIPTSSDGAVVTNYTVTVGAQPMNVGSVTVVGGTLILGSSTNVAWSFSQTGGTVNYANGWLVTSNYLHNAGTKNNVATFSIDCGSNTQNRVYESVNSLVASNLLAARPGETTHLVEPPYETDITALTLQGGTLSLQGSVSDSVTAILTPPTITAPSTLTYNSSSSGSYFWFLVPRNATTDLSSIAANLSVNLPMNLSERCFGIVAASGSGNATVLITNVPYVNWNSSLGRDFSGQMTTYSGTKLQWIIANSTVFFQSIGNFWGLNTGTGGSLLLSNSALFVERNTNDTGNVTGFSGAEFYLSPSGTNSLTLINSRIVTATRDTQLPNYVYLTNSTIMLRPSAYESQTDVGAALGMFADSTNSWVCLSQHNTSYTRTIYGGFYDACVIDVGTVANWGNVQLGAATTFNTLTMIGAANFYLNGYTLIASNLILTAGPLYGSSSTLLISDSFLVRGGSFIPQTSTVQLGINMDPVNITVTNFYNLACSTAGKPVNLTNGPTLLVAGTLAMTGAAGTPIALNGSLGSGVANLVLSNASYGWFVVSSNLNIKTGLLNIYGSASGSVTGRVQFLPRPFDDM